MSSQKITVRTTPRNRILINTLNGAGSGVQELVQLKDVDASNIANNDTLVYNEASGKFVVEELPIINGGDF
jgi:site-specific recombinase XerD